MALLCLFACASGLCQSYPPEFATSQAYAKGDQVQYAGNTFRALGPVSPSSNYPTKDYSDWEMIYVRANTSLIIGTANSFPTLQIAWNYIQNTKVADGAYLHLVIAAPNTGHKEPLPVGYSESFSGGFCLNHSSGANIALVSTIAGGATLNFTGGTSGFFLSGGHTFGGIFGNALLTLKGVVSASPTYGVQVNDSSHLEALDQLTIDTFQEGVEAGPGSSINADAVTITDVVDAAEALYGGYISFTGLNLDGGTISDNGLVAIDGEITALSATFTNVPTAVYSKDHGFIDVSSSTITGSGYGILCQFRGHAKAEDATISGSALDDVSVSGNSSVDAIDATYTTSADYGNSAIFTDSTS